LEVNPMSKPTYKIHLNRKVVVAPKSPMTGLEILALGDYGPEFELYLLRGEGDPSGGELVGPDTALELKNGMHFRAIPGNANFG
jgi:hypothetical protein